MSLQTGTFAMTMAYLSVKPIPPFPQALAESRKDEQNKDLYETFRRCEVNIPLLDAIE